MKLDENIEMEDWKKYFMELLKGLEERVEREENKMERGEERREHGSMARTEEEEEISREEVIE